MIDTFIHRAEGGATMKMICHAFDVCLPDYWSGHHMPHVQVAVTRRKMSFAEIRRAIRHELRHGYVMGSSDDARMLSADFTPDERRANALNRAAYAAVNRDVVGARKGQRYADTGVDIVDDDDATVCMYFVFEVIE